MTNKKINPGKTLYIKLGSKGRWEHECIYETQTLRIGYNTVPHEDCLYGDWQKVRKAIEKDKEDKGAIT